MSGIRANYAFLPALRAAQRAFMLAASLALPSGVRSLFRFFDLAGFLAAFGALAFLLRFFLLAGLEGVTASAVSTTEVSGHLITLAISFSMSATALMRSSFFEVMLSKLRRVSLVRCLMSISGVGNRMGLVGNRKSKRCQQNLYQWHFQLSLAPARLTSFNPLLPIFSYS